MIFLSFLSFRTFPFNNNFNGVFKRLYDQNIVTVGASGSRVCWDQSSKKDINSKPEYCVDPKSPSLWCSDYDWNHNKFPYLQINFQKSRLALSGYSIQAGCCEYSYGCCCTPFSWEISGSNDNKTWTKIHSIEKNKFLTNCANQSFSLPSKSIPYKSFRMTQTEPVSGCPTCMDLLRFEVYGDFDGSSYIYSEDFDDQNDDEVSIIGKVTNIDHKN